MTKQEQTKPAYEFPIYSKEELRELYAELRDKYNSGRTVKDINQWYIDNHALTPSLAIILSNYQRDIHGKPTYDYPSIYTKLQNKLEQMYTLLRKTEYAKKQELLRLEELSNTMQIN